MELSMTTTVAPAIGRAVAASVTMPARVLAVRPKSWVLGPATRVGLAVAANIRCPYCLYFHQTLSKAAGATDDELAETAVIAGLTSRWSAMLHAQRYNLETLEKEGQKMGEYLSKKGAKSKKK